MNILQILPELNLGGVETGTVDLAKYLVRAGHKAVVVSNGGALVKELQASGAVHYQLQVHNKNPITMFKVIPRLIEIIEKEKIDIVHARSRAPAWIAYFACRRSKAVFITTCHGYYRRHFFSRVMGWGKQVIVLSNIIARHMIEDFGVPQERIKLVPRSVDLEKFTYFDPKDKRKAEFNVGIIGRITPIKGHLYFIKAMARVAKAVPQLKVWVVGDAPPAKEAYKESIQVLTKRLGLWNNTEFLGAQRDIPGVLAHLDVLVLATTTHEAFGRVIIEAQAAGVPVVATKVGGVVDIISDGINGLLVPPADPASMAEAVIRIFQDKDLARSLAERALSKVKEKYSVELMLENTLKVYNEALGAKKLLIIKFSSLGDIILSTAGLRAIREKFQADYKISFLTGLDSREVLMGCPYIDELLVADLKNRDKGIWGLWKLGRQLRRQRFDKVVDLQNNRKSHILASLSLAAQRFGYENKKFSFLLNQRVKDELPLVGPVEHQFRILEMLGINLQDARLELWPSPEDYQYIEQWMAGQWLSAQQKIVGINISASRRWLTKNWPLEHLIKLCVELGTKDVRVVVTGTEKDLSLANALVNGVKNGKIINACAKTSVNQLACLIKKCRVYISADSSPLHIAAAMNTPFVAMFGPTDPRRHLPPAKDFILLKKELPCSPCYKTDCKTRKCMELIAPQEVLEAVDKLLA
ncbi:MAG: GT4 family glycosyltransferase PelF [Candidatus Omnitrophota bacterium]